ncbi:MAG: hypothetical protein J5534_03985 [Fibrobacter sp.]|nr:hypothetical protein [Fibrobacter sp.]
MFKRLGLVIILLVSIVSASDTSWKTFDIKTGPAIGGWNNVSATTASWSLSIVKPITQYIGVGVFAEVGTTNSNCEDCVSYKFDELFEGVLVNLNYPIWGGFSVVSNFMFLVNFQDGTYEGESSYMKRESVDDDGNRVVDYQYEYDEGNYYRESFMFRSNLGFAWRTKSNFFGLEFYPTDIAVTEYDACLTFSLNAVLRVF